MADVKFVDGLIIKSPREGAPDFVKGSISIKREELITWLSKETEEWINLDVLQSKKDASKWYAQVNTYKPDVNAPQANSEASSTTSEGVAYPEEEINPEDIPF